MKPEAELLWRLYEEHRNSTRHHDEQREKITHCVLLLTAAVLGIVQFSDLPGPVSMILAFFLIVAGLGGAFLTSMHSEDCKGGIRCALDYRDQLGAQYPEIKLEPHAQPKFTSPIPWLGIHILVVLLGAALLLAVFYKP